VERLETPHPEAGNRIQTNQAVNGRPIQVKVPATAADNHH
jgi:hypothetical protein